ncbi:LysR family transcriptional regulator [Polaromonas sp.]|uniref:LysR family transcriptional regulator n=1 Tax=Polaromonas sp. TaxID=1869339 RepID=UPI003BACA3AC
MKLRHLEYLRWIIAGGSFEQAAASAGVSQSAITQAMNALQRELGLVLFKREGKRKIPTAEAIAVAEAGYELQRAMEKIDPSGSAASQATELRVGMAPAAGLLYSPAIYDTMRTLAPASALRLDTGNAPGLLARLLQGDLDLVIAPQPRNLRNGRLNQHVMYTSEPFVYCRAGHPLANARTLAEIEGQEWAVAGVPGTPGNVIEEAFRVRKLATPRVAVHCTDYSMLINLVAHSDLMGVVSHPALVREPDSLGLQALSLVEGMPHYSVCLFWTSDAQLCRAPHARDAVLKMLLALGDGRVTA